VDGAGEEFGSQRLAAAMSELSGSSLAEQHAAVLDDVRQFARGNFTDDVTLLLLSVKPEAAS